MNKFVFPIRLKVLISILGFLMLVVGVITATMADLFHQDKTAYVRDFSVTVTSEIKTEIDWLLNGYVSASQVLTEVMFADDIDPDQKQRLARPLFAAYPAILAMVTADNRGKPLAIYNASAVRAAGTDATELLDVTSLALEQSGISLALHSAQLRSGGETIAITLRYSLSNGTENRIVTAIVTPELFQQALDRAGAFDALLIDTQGAPVIESAGSGTDLAWAGAVLQEFDQLESGAGGVVDLWDNGVQYFAGAENIARGGLYVVTRISVSAAYLTARQLLKDLVLVGLIIVLIASIGGVIVSRRFTHPLERLSAGVRKVGKGDFDVSVDIVSKDEIGQLSTSFNEMADELKKRESSLQSAQLALVQSEKMAAIGTLSAGLAHEVKNPLSAVLGYAQLSKRKLSQPDVVRKHLDTIESETRRCNEIIGNLMQFSRQEKGDFSDTSVNDIVTKSADIVDHQLSLNNVRVQTNLDPDNPQVFGNANQLQQVIMNMAINAQHAMAPDGGTVDFDTYTDEDSVYIAVSDTGPGMTQEVARKIFEPFFTTKPAGQGTGLGLSVSYGIIRNHKGDISVESSASGGARFVIQLPLNMSRELASAGVHSLGQAS